MNVKIPFIHFALWVAILMLNKYLGILSIDAQVGGKIEKIKFEGIERIFEDYSNNLHGF
jgi:predicted transcriptional regulator